MKLIVLKCPSCAGNLEVSEKEAEYRCLYCSTTVVVRRDNGGSFLCYTREDYEQLEAEVSARRALEDEESVLKARESALKARHQRSELRTDVRDPDREILMKELHGMRQTAPHPLEVFRDTVKDKILDHSLKIGIGVAVLSFIVGAVLIFANLGRSSPKGQYTVGFEHTYLREKSISADQQGLLRAIMRKDSDAIRAIYKLGTEDKGEPNKEGPFLLGIRWGDSKVIETLVECGVEPPGGSKGARTVVSILKQHITHNKMEMIDAAINAGVSVEIKDSRRCTLLAHAVALKDPQQAAIATEALLEKGASPYGGYKRCVPMELARKNHPEVLIPLFERHGHKVEASSS